VRFINLLLLQYYSRARLKSYSLGKIIYPWNKSRFFHEIYSVYRWGFSPHILQILLKWQTWFNRYNGSNFFFTFSSEHEVASWIFSNNESNFAQLVRQHFKRFSKWMSAALSVFKLSVQSVRQLQQHTIEVSFGVYELKTVANHSISIARQSLARQCWSVLACIASQYIAHHTWQSNGLRSGDLNISKVIFILKPESQVNYLFTLKNVHLSSNSYNF